MLLGIFACPDLRPEPLLELVRDPEARARPKEELMSALLIGPACGRADVELVNLDERTTQPARGATSTAGLSSLARAAPGSLLRARSVDGVKPAAPEVLRRGVLVRVAASRDHDDVAEVLALAFLDLRFVDGHIERWIGPGSIGELSTKPDAIVALQAWARERAGDFAFDIMCEVARDYDVPNPPVVDALPCDEVVIEWNSRPVWREHEA